jgi:ribosomal protein S18 acetylase RimI-like enzyme
MALWRVRATVDDRPGFLSVLTASLALKAINILAVQVHTTEAGAVDDFLVDAPDQLTEAELLAAVHRGRGRDAWVARADAHGLVDAPTRALGLANRVVQDPESLGAALAALVDGEVSWRPAPDHERCVPAPDSERCVPALDGERCVPAPDSQRCVPGLDGERSGRPGTIMRLPDPAGGYYLVSRDAPEFTPAEYARAQALVDLAATAGRQATLLLDGGAEVVVRPAGPDDLDAVHAMYLRCSATSRHRRHLGVAAGQSRARLARLLVPARGFALVASGGGPTGDPQVVALATLTGEGVLAQAAVLVEDAWQRRGIGTALLRRLVRLAVGSGYAAVSLHTLSENDALLRTLCRLGHAYTAEHDGPLVSITLPLASGPRTAPSPHFPGKCRSR